VINNNPKCNNILDCKLQKSGLIRASVVAGNLEHRMMFLVLSELWNCKLFDKYEDLNNLIGNPAATLPTVF